MMYKIGKLHYTNLRNCKVSESEVSVCVMM